MSNNFEQDLSDVRDFIALGGGASGWFARAYASWYWCSDFWKVNLNGYLGLDSSNKKLFEKMLNLRAQAGWNDSALHEVALFAIERWNLLQPEKI